MSKSVTTTPAQEETKELTGELKCQCTIFDTCEAPLCPLDKESLEQGLWYPDEEVCKARKFQTLPWVRRQKRIQKLGLGYDAGFFTVRMLEAIKAIGKGLKGANPDSPDSEESWLKVRTGERQGFTEAQPPDKQRDNKAAKRKEGAETALRKTLTAVA